MLVDFVYGMPTWQLAVLVVGLFILAADIGLYICVRVFPFELREKHNEFVGLTTELVGVFFAILLGFIAVAAWESFGKAADTATVEASLTGDLARDANTFSEPMRTRMLVDLRNYVDIVITKEWPAMADGIEFGDEGSEPLYKLHQDLVSIHSEDSMQVAIFSETLARLNSLYDARRSRILAADDHIDPTVWWVVLLGAGITIATTFFFGMASFKVHLAMTSIGAASLALVIVLIAAFDYPFRGQVQVGPDAFLLVKHSMERMGVVFPNHG